MAIYERSGKYHVWAKMRYTSSVVWSGTSSRSTGGSKEVVTPAVTEEME